MKKTSLFIPKISFISLLCFIIIIHVNAQSDFWSSSNAYLGQTLPNDTPKLFASNMLIAANDTGFALDRVAFSNDGKEFYYCYNTSWFNITNLKIKYFAYTNNHWQGPFVLNEKFQTPTFSVDGNTLYFPGGDSIGAVVWQSERTATGWLMPERGMRNELFKLRFHAHHQWQYVCGDQWNLGQSAGLFHL